MASSSQRAGTQPPLSLWILNVCKDSCSWEEVITTPNSPAGSGLAIAREEWDGNVSSLSHNNRQWQIYTPVVSQRMRWCFLTLHRKAESCSCSSDPAERKTGGKNTLQNTLFVLAGIHDEGEGRRVSRVICRFGKTVINMTNGARFVFVCHRHGPD